MIIITVGARSQSSYFYMVTFTYFQGTGLFGELFVVSLSMEQLGCNSCRLEKGHANGNGCACVRADKFHLIPKVERLYELEISSQTTSLVEFYFILNGALSTINVLIPLLRAYLLTFLPFNDDLCS